MQSISAEGAIHWRVESRFQPRKLRALPQANVKRAPLALNRYLKTMALIAEGADIRRLSRSYVYQRVERKAPWGHAA